MMDSLPVGDFKYLDEDDTSKLKRLIQSGGYSNWNEKFAFQEACAEGMKDMGYYMQVTLDLPEHLHDKFDQWPLLIKTGIPDDNDLSPDQLRLKEELRLKSHPKVMAKLCNDGPTWLHYSYLKFCLEEGYVLKEIHHAIQFRQEPVLKPYIVGNTKLRTEALCEFYKDFFKWAINVIYGKTLQSTRKHRNSKFCWSNEEFQNQVRRTTFKDYIKFSETCSLALHCKTMFSADRPVYLGCTILQVILLG
jgi:hypothetical protein